MHSAVHKYSHSIWGTLNHFTIRDISTANNNHFAEETDIPRNLSHLQYVTIQDTEMRARGWSGDNWGGMTARPRDARRPAGAAQLQTTPAPEPVLRFRHLSERRKGWI